jgi:DNA repair protein RadC
LLRTGPLVAATTLPRDLFRVALQADANAIAVVRGTPRQDVSLTVHDQHALKRFGETAGWLSIRFVDYLIISTDAGLTRPSFLSWRTMESCD